MMISRYILVTLAIFLFCTLAGSSVIQQIQTALKTEIFPADLQKIKPSMKYTDATFGMLDPTTIETKPKRVHNINELNRTISPNAEKTILSKNKYIGQNLYKIEPKTIDGWSNYMEKGNRNSEIRKIPSKKEGYYQLYSFGYYFFPFEHHCTELGCEPVPDVYQPFKDGYFPGSDFVQYFDPKYHPVDSLEPSVRHAILKYMPNIPVELANALYYLEPGFVSYIVNHHNNLQELMTNMDPMTVQFLMTYIPELPSLIAKMEPKAIEAIFLRVEHTCDYLAHFQDQYPVKIIAGKVPWLHRCIWHIVTEKSTTTTATTTTTVAQAPTTTEVVFKYPPFYKKEDIDEASTVIPEIGELLNLVKKEKLEAIHKVIPSISAALNELSKERIDFINEHINTIIDLVQNTDKKLLQEMQKFTNGDPLIELAMEFL